MRLFLLPISTRQSLLYCHRLNRQLTRETTWPDKISTRASNIWLSWEKKESGWQKKVTEYGNKMFQRLPHEEWSLKSIPPMSARRSREEIEGKEEVRIEYPEEVLEESRVLETLRKLGADEKQAFHLKWFLGSIVGMPLSAPVALIPIIPNLPFFYLCFRAWSHWRARSGSQHLEFLLKNNLLKLKPSSTLRTAYRQATLDTSLQQLQEEARSISRSGDSKYTEEDSPEQMLLSKSSGKIVAEQLNIPALALEMERAVWQIERSIKARRELRK
ncbi:MAG: hypothetical protein Q9217_004688 [Psora testacea]